MTHDDCMEIVLARVPAHMQNAAFEQWLVTPNVYLAHQRPNHVVDVNPEWVAQAVSRWVAQQLR